METTLMTDLAINEVAADDERLAEGTFPASGGTRLFYRHWRPSVATSKKALILLHRGHEHSARFQGLVEALGLDDFHVFAWDARGHGRSPGERGYAESFSTMVADLDAFVRFLSLSYDVPIENMVVLGHSVAAVMVSAWVHDYAPPIRAMVLATPALRIKLYVPFAIPGLRLLQAVRPKSLIKSYVKAKMLTHDPSQAKGYENDALISRSIAVNILLDVHDTATRLIDDAAAIQTPALVLSAGSDWVVKNSAQARFFQRLGSRLKQLHVYPGFFHAIFHEAERQLVADAVKDFIEQSFRRGAESPSLLDAHEDGYTKREYDCLRTPLPMACPRRLSFEVQKGFLKAFGKLSEGISLGWRTGFDSGQSLDYIYENKARGVTPLGKLIDRIFLNAIGWRGIRIRRQNLESALLRTIDQVRGTGQPVRLLDIAAGPGRYMLEALKQLPADAAGDVSALLRDHNVEGLEQGRRLAREMGLANVEYSDGDAFNTDSLARIAPAPNIAVVSGLYELFPDNEKVLASLKGLAAALGRGGYLIYTNQPWHPQVEMIARVLINRDQQPWVMRRRTQAEMDQLVQSVGFEKTDMTIDRHGIFTVSVARRVCGNV